LLQYFLLVSTFFAKRKLLKDIKNKINSGDWLILNEEDFSPTMSIIEKSVFEAKFYFGSLMFALEKEPKTEVKYSIASIFPSSPVIRSAVAGSLIVPLSSSIVV
jgi:hypothetical protein